MLTILIHELPCCHPLSDWSDCARTNGWVNHRNAGDMRRHLDDYDFILMWGTHHVVPWKHSAELQTLSWSCQDSLYNEVPHNTPALLFTKRTDVLPPQDLVNSQSREIWWNNDIFGLRLPMNSALKTKLDNGLPLSHELLMILYTCFMRHDSQWTSCKDMGETPHQQPP